MRGNRTERVLQIAIGALTAALIFVVAGAVRERVVGVNDKAPDFKITTDSGRTLSRSDFGGKLLVLNFWATWCPPCIEELPSLNEFQRRLAPSGVVVLGLSVDRNEAAYRAFLKRAGIAFETARDPDGSIGAGYGTFKYPETYVIDARGRVVQKHIGPRDWMDPELLASIQALL